MRRHGQTRAGRCACRCAGGGYDPSAFALIEFEVQRQHVNHRLADDAKQALLRMAVHHFLD